jgi:hypothetical protein
MQATPARTPGIDYGTSRGQLMLTKKLGNESENKPTEVLLKDITARPFFLERWRRGNDSACKYEPGIAAKVALQAAEDMRAR